MVGYADPCPCCGSTKRRREARLDRSDSLPLRRSPALRPAKFPRSASDPTPCSAAAAALTPLDAMKTDRPAEEPAAAMVVPEQEPEKDAEMVQERQAKDSAVRAMEHKQIPPLPPASTGEEADMKEQEAKESAEKVTEQKHSPSTPPVSTGDEAEMARFASCFDLSRASLEQEPEAKESAEKASGEEAAAKATPEMTAEVRMAKGVQVSISFLCKCGACCQEVNLA